MVVNLFWKLSFLVEASTPLPTNGPEDGYLKSDYLVAELLHLAIIWTTGTVESYIS